MANLKIGGFFFFSNKALYWDRKQLVEGLYFWRIRLGCCGEKLLSAVSDEWVIGNDSSASSSVLACESAVFLSSVSMLPSQLRSTFPGEGLSLPCCLGPGGSAHLMGPLSVTQEKESQDWLIVFMQMFLHFLRIVGCLWRFLLPSRKIQRRSIQRMKFGIGAIVGSSS